MLSYQFVNDIVYHFQYEYLPILKPLQIGMLMGPTLWTIALLLIKNRFLGCGGDLNLSVVRRLRYNRGNDKLLVIEAFMTSSKELNTGFKTLILYSYKRKSASEL